MKQIALAIATLMMTIPAFAKKDCTNEPQTKWMSEAAFKAKAKRDGYKIDIFKQIGTCYELYGEKNGAGVESYFNPVTGALVKENVN